MIISYLRNKIGILFKHLPKYAKLLSAEVNFRKLNRNNLWRPLFWISKIMPFRPTLLILLIRLKMNQNGLFLGFWFLTWDCLFWAPYKFQVKIWFVHSRDHQYFNLECEMCDFLEWKFFFDNINLWNRLAKSVYLHTYNIQELKLNITEC